jgi:hypothetical protein
MFLTSISPRELLIRLDAYASVFMRGMPKDEDLQVPAIALVFSIVLRETVVTKSSFLTEGEQDALQLCFRKGWLHADKVREIGRPEEVGYFFTSQLHRWYVEWKLFDTVPQIPFQADNLLICGRRNIQFLPTPSLSRTKGWPRLYSATTGSPVSGRILPQLSHVFEGLPGYFSRIRNSKRTGGVLYS